MRLYVLSTALVIPGLLLLAVSAYGQERADRRVIDILYSDLLYSADTPEGLREWFGGNVKLRHDSTYLYCDTAYILNRQYVDAVGNTSIVEGDSLQIFADSLTYDSQTGVAWLIGRVLMINGDQELHTDQLQYDTRTRTATYYTGGWLASGDTRIFCMRGRYHVESRTVYMEDSVQVSQPGFRLRADSMYYKMDEDRVYFTGPTRMRQDSADLYCESGYYNLEAGNGWFEVNAQFADPNRKAQAERIFYDARTNDFQLIDQARFEEEGRLAMGDTLTYFQGSGDFFIRGNGFMQDGVQTIQADGIDYNTRTERFRTLGRARIQDGAQFLAADDITNTDSTDLVLVTGNVSWIDTTANIELRCDSAVYQRSQGYFQAMGEPPLLIQVVDGDTLYLVADQIISQRNQEDSSRIILAYHHVLSFKSDMQIACDSMVYRDADSLFMFYHDPVIWSDSSQFTADTIRMQMANKRVDTIFLMRRALIITTADLIYFSQIKGREITAIFQDNAIHTMWVNGNAQTVYYVLDDDGAYLGVNQSECSDMVFYFEDGQVSDIYYLRKPASTMFPMGQVDHEQLKLEGFRWREEERPSGYHDMLRKWHALHDRLYTPPTMPVKDEELPPEKDPEGTPGGEDGGLGQRE
jgi:lipopolysaccharide export system protein LptA